MASSGSGGVVTAVLLSLLSMVILGAAVAWWYYRKTAASFWKWWPWNKPTETMMKKPLVQGDESKELSQKSDVASPASPPDTYQQGYAAVI